MKFMKKRIQLQPKLHALHGEKKVKLPGFAWKRNKKTV